MASSNRATVINKTFKVLKKHFKPVPVHQRTVLEHLLFACLLENSRPEKAEEAFARIQQMYYDWNEVRVTTVRELMESCEGLADPQASATHLKKTLQSVFESIYAFDLEDLKKQNLGKAVKQLEMYSGTTPFVVAYVTQHALGGHSIPLCRASLDVMYIVGATSEAERAKEVVPGLDRAIPKSQGIEFASLLHQLGAEFEAGPHSTRVRDILVEVSADAKSRFPKRTGKRGEGDGAEECDAAAPEKLPAAKRDAKSPSKKSDSPEKGVAKKKGSDSEPGTNKPSKQLARRKPR